MYPRIVKVLVEYNLAQLPLVFNSALEKEQKHLKLVELSRDI